MSKPTLSRSRFAATRLALAAAVVALLGLSAAPVSAAPKPPPTPDGPQLSIAVDNGHTSADAGDRLSYVITLTNVGTEDVSDLLVTQSLPTGTSLLSADRDGDEKSDLVQWKVDLRATQKATFKTSLELAETPAEVLRLASVACAKVSAEAAPVVCASDSDLLPAGAAAARAEVPPVTSVDPSGRTALYVGAGAGALLAAGLAALLVLRSRRRPGARRS